MFFSPYNYCPFYRYYKNMDSYKYDSMDIKYKQNNFINSKKTYNKAKINEQILSPDNFKITYPFVENIRNDSLKKIINNKIINEVSNLFKEQVLLPEKVNFIEVIEFYEMPLNKRGLLSILFGIYTYTGGAHGYTAYSSITIDLDTGKVYNFNDLFTTRINYKPILEDKVREYIKQNDIPILEEYKGIDKNQQFYLTPTELVIYYQVYTYTPYAYGLFKIPIPYKDILNLLGPASPIQKLL
ncbi:DUF3298 and DUF4163 domain-containing protein [Clostridium niameyense]|uniref:DUF3298 and DUF4163 domain-containing protein n=1 Tax=Clostridium niameyense TaxID=1622073 RepID=UPI000A7B2379|nr:DUF3298 and DUF4163 domain-containing protein [Clostridium niameyense]